MERVLRYSGKVVDLRDALRRLGNVEGSARANEVGLRRVQRELRRAEMRSLARQILGGRWGGDAA